MRNQSENLYDLWVGGRYATHQDVAGLFFARSVDLYLKDGGVIGMVMPHSAFADGAVSQVAHGTLPFERMMRTLSVDFGFKAAWDLERLEPNTFFRCRPAWRSRGGRERRAARSRCRAAWSAGLARRDRRMYDGRARA